MDPLLLIAFVACCGLSASAAGYGLVRLVGAAGEDAHVRQRLRKLIDEDATPRRAAMTTRMASLRSKVAGLLTGLFANHKGAAKDNLRRRLAQAGIYAADAPRAFVAARVVLLLVVGVGATLLAMVSGYDWTLGAAIGGGIGYLLPNLWIGRCIRANHIALMKGLPDALDLLIVCIEAGLTLDAAMHRVGDELALAHPAIARELNICHMETQIGLSRTQAFKNLGERSGYAPLKSLTAMLTQADRFGTSIATALRVQSDGMRSKRQHRAEEAAGKASVKLTFPLVLFIFPASFLVLMGPTILKMMDSSFFS